MKIYIDKDDLCVGDILDVIKEENIDSHRRVLIDEVDGGYVILSLGAYNDTVTIRGDFNNRNENDSITVACFLQHLNNFERNNIIAILDKDCSDLNGEKDDYLIGVHTIYIDEDTKSLVLATKQ